MENPIYWNENKNLEFWHGHEIELFQFVGDARAEQNADGTEPPASKTQGDAE